MSASIEWVSKGGDGQEPQIRFKSNINVDDGYRNNPQGEFESEMTLYKHKRPGEYGIEWVVGDGDFVEGIGLWFDEEKNLVDYDGVFELPEQAILMLRELGFTVSEEYEPQ